MKKTIFAISLTIILVLSCVCMTGCEKTLSGSYVGQSGSFLGIVSGDVTLTFEGNKITAVSETVVLGNTLSQTYNGTYVIESDDEGNETITMTFDLGNENQTVSQGAKSFSEGKDSNGNKTITIDGTTYTKQK